VAQEVLVAVSLVVGVLLVVVLHLLAARR